MKKNYPTPPIEDISEGGLRATFFLDTQCDPTFKKYTRKQNHNSDFTNYEEK